MAISGWIPVGVSTPRCTEVVRIAYRARVSRREAFASLVEFWIWVSQESADGFLAGYTLKSLTLVVEGTNESFWAAVADEGWLEVREDGIQVPENKEHQYITTGGRARALKANRQGKWKSKKALLETVEEALAETREETFFDEKTSPGPSLGARPTATTTKSINKPTKLTTSIGEQPERFVVGLEGWNSAESWCHAEETAKRLGLSEVPEYLHRVAALVTAKRISATVVAGIASEAKKSAVENPVGLFITKLRAADKRIDGMAKAVEFTADYLRGPPEATDGADIVANLAQELSRKDSP